LVIKVILTSRGAAAEVSKSGRKDFGYW